MSELVISGLRAGIGERAIIDVIIEVGGRLVASLEHEAIIALPGAG